MILSLKNHFTILVQGLSVALLLQLQGCNVTIVARASPDSPKPYDPSYTSPKAGANWQSFADPDDYKQQGSSHIYAFLFPCPSKLKNIKSWMNRPSTLCGD